MNLSFALSTSPCCYTQASDSDTLRNYYGTADKSIAMAIAKVRAMFQWLNENDKNLARFKFSRRSSDLSAMTPAR
jgi:hypothetical protein